ncbi:hypothetical protein [Marinomonas mediterranea]|uniref:hypothetical protein n=1 Tax=Marinomonas mediterranea TaxID=119864 RepID=UPI00234B6461|nr:hypothetical protein [Marinomonas mediterranea]WCN07768.1 hypothetical protein GV055_01925 [Marinomonas mediterranea]WCN11868.1 hypothetical protein GV054_01950 [Marinomonas mediterranea]
MKKIQIRNTLKTTSIVSMTTLTLIGCAAHTPDKDNESVATSAPIENVCIGTTDLPDSLSPYFEEVQDEALLTQTLGQPEKGMLCQGKVYQAKADTQVPLYRAWNSTNPHSQFGKWWAFSQPEGLVSKYRSDYEICYQWSPLDKLVSCTLKAGTKVVVGNGQSAMCSKYLTYDVSQSQQVYLAEAEQSLSNCDVKDAVFSWE